MIIYFYDLSVQWLPQTCVNFLSLHVHLAVASTSCSTAHAVLKLLLPVGGKVPLTNTRI